MLTVLTYENIVDFFRYFIDDQSSQSLVIFLIISYNFMLNLKILNVIFVKKSTIFLDKLTLPALPSLPPKWINVLSEKKADETEVISADKRGIYKIRPTAISFVPLNALTDKKEKKKILCHHFQKVVFKTKIFRCKQSKRGICKIHAHLSVTTVHGPWWLQSNQRTLQGLRYLTEQIAKWYYDKF